MTEKTNAATADHATIRNALNLNELCLIGTFGTDDKPGALLRASGGRISKVSVGDRVGQREVAAIGSGHIMLAKGGFTKKLSIGVDPEPVPDAVG